MTLATILTSNLRLNNLQSNSDSYLNSYVNKFFPTIEMPHPALFPPNWNYVSLCLPDGKSGLFFQKTIEESEPPYIRTYVLSHYIYKSSFESENSIIIFIPEESRKITLTDISSNPENLKKLSSLSRNFMYKVFNTFKNEIPSHEQITNLRNESDLFPTFLFNPT